MRSMADETDVLLGLIGDKSKVSIQQGQFAKALPGGCLVNMGDSQVPALLGTSWLPEIGELVSVWVIDGKPVVMGPLATKPDRGTVKSVASNLVTLSTAFQDVTCPWSGSTPTVGQAMKLIWHGGPTAFPWSTQPSSGTAPTPGGGTQTHALAFAAIGSGSYNGRWWTSLVRADDSDVGAWFYGTQIKDTIPSNAVITRVQIWLPWQSQTGAAPLLGAHPNPFQPAGAPGTSSFSSLPYAGTGWYDLATSYGDLLKAGGPSYGIGVAPSSGLSIWSSLAQDGQSGKLVITCQY
jgi:hypothetical protein